MSKFRTKISPESVAKGMTAEELFQEWLNDSRLPFIYPTQDLQSVPGTSGERSSGRIT
jgi:hypothetical protein